MLRARRAAEGEGDRAARQGGRAPHRAADPVDAMDVGEQVVGHQHLDREDHGRTDSQGMVGQDQVVPGLDAVHVQHLRSRRRVAVAIDDRVAQRLGVAGGRERRLVLIPPGVEVHHQRATRQRADGRCARWQVVGRAVGAGPAESTGSVRVVVGRAIDRQLRDAAAVGPEARVASPQIARQQVADLGGHLDGALQDRVQLGEVGHHQAVGVDMRLPVVCHRIEVVLAVVRQAVPARGAIVRTAHGEGMRRDLVRIQETAPDRLFSRLDADVLVVLVAAAAVLRAAQRARVAQAKGRQTVGQEVREVLRTRQLARVGETADRRVQRRIVVGAAARGQTVNQRLGIGHGQPGALRRAVGAEGHQLNAHLPVLVIAVHQVVDGVLGHLQARQPTACVGGVHAPRDVQNHHQVGIHRSDGSVLQAIYNLGRIIFDAHREAGRRTAERRVVGDRGRKAQIQHIFNPRAATLGMIDGPRQRRGVGGRIAAARTRHRIDNDRHHLGASCTARQRVRARIPAPGHRDAARGDAVGPTQRNRQVPSHTVGVGDQDRARGSHGIRGI